MKVGKPAHYSSFYSLTVFGSTLEIQSQAEIPLKQHRYQAPSNTPGTSFVELIAELEYTVFNRLNQFSK